MEGSKEVGGEKKKRTKVFMDIQINKENIGRFIFELYDDITPITAYNFRCLCTGEKGTGKKTKMPLHYKNTIFHRVIKDFMIQGGDFSKFNGTGGESIYDGRFKDENFIVKHDKPGLLSMANAGPDSNGSQFFLTCAKVPHLDNEHVVFGELIKGFDVLNVITSQKTVKDRPVHDVTVADCGLYEEEEEKSDRKRENDDSESGHKKKRRKEEKEKKEK
eukprot:Sspe_Gene.33759::Locus_16453_Transcript_1_1_Confidence_1.000_Length_717::g.33759::m.33759/K05864/PPID, CYPD; peptidyl-prolyl isomerase D